MSLLEYRSILTASSCCKCAGWSERYAVTAPKRSTPVALAYKESQEMRRLKLCLRLTMGMTELEHLDCTYY